MKTTVSISDIVWFPINYFVLVNKEGLSQISHNWGNTPQSISFRTWSWITIDIISSWPQLLVTASFLCEFTLFTNIIRVPEPKQQPAEISDHWVSPLNGYMNVRVGRQWYFLLLHHKTTCMQTFNHRLQNFVWTCCLWQQQCMQRVKEVTILSGILQIIRNNYKSYE